LEAGARVDARDRPGNTPLHDAAVAGQLDAVKLLLAAGATIDAQDDRGRTPLHEAARKGRAEVAEFLINAGARPDLRDRLGQTPLDTAREANQWEVAKLLLNHCEGAGHCGGARSNTASEVLLLGWEPSPPVVNRATG
jgi:cytohesin